MANCRQAVDHLLDFLDRSLNAEAHDAVHDHMRACPACVAFLKTYRKTVRLCQRALRREAPPGLAERVLTIVGSTRARRGS